VVYWDTSFHIYNFNTDIRRNKEQQIKPLFLTLPAIGIAAYVLSGGLFSQFCPEGLSVKKTSVLHGAGNAFPNR